MAEISYGDALVAQNDRLAEAFAGAEWSAPVPTCPGWTLLQLLRHVGRGDRWAAQMIHEGGFVEPQKVTGGRPPDDRDGALDWLRQGPQLLLEAVATAGTATPVWTFLGPRPAAWWLRRRLHEATVHRADAEIAADQAYQLDPALAADAISEWTDLVQAMAEAGGSPVLEGAEVIRLEATEPDAAPGSWVLRAADNADPASPPSVVLAGRAVDLLLALVRRQDLHQSEPDPVR